MQKLQPLVESRQNNNLNAIRVLLAILVIFSHSFALTFGKEGDPLFTFTRHQATFGKLAVDLFFFISGFLITASWLNSKSMNDYLRRRILRIVPGYIAALIFSFLVASAFADHPMTDLHSRLLKFKDIVSLGYSSSTGDWVFSHNPFPFAANGSLWTINREFFCYVLIAAIGLFGFFKHRFLILMGFLMMFAYYGLTLLKGENIEHLDRRFFTFFLAGTCVWLWRDKIPIHPIFAILALVIALLTSQFPPCFQLLAPFTACYLVLGAGFAFRIKSLAWCDKTDLSYGAYLFAFPIQQAVAFAGIKNPWESFVIAAPLSLAVAFLSWTFVEKPSLQMKSRDFSDHDPVAGVQSKESRPTTATAKTSW